VVVRTVVGAAVVVVSSSNKVSSKQAITSKLSISNSSGPFLTLSGVISITVAVILFAKIADTLPRLVEVKTCKKIVHALCQKYIPFKYSYDYAMRGNPLGCCN
jgi:hypothetical protein